MKKVINLLILAYGLFFIFNTLNVFSMNNEKFQTNEPFTVNCVTDNADIIENEENMTKAIENFYKDTGVQCYVYTVDKINTSDGYYKSYFDNNINKSNAVLITKSKDNTSVICGKDAVDIFNISKIDKLYNNDNFEATLVNSLENSFNSTVAMVLFGLSLPILILIPLLKVNR
jgi:hypothetical protein